jgi:hypothetical protein
MEKALQKPSFGKRVLPLAALLLASVIFPLQAAPPPLDAVALDGAPEPATFALIGAALCLLSLRLRRRNSRP